MFKSKTINDMQIGDTLELKDLVLPPGVEIMESLQQPILVLAAPTIAAVEAPPEAEEAEGEEKEPEKEAQEQPKEKDKDKDKE